MNNGHLDRRQIRALYEAHGRVLLAYARAILKDHAASEDVLHQVFLRLLQGRVSIAGPPAHYLLRAVRNAALNHRRDHGREVGLPSNGRWLEAPPGMDDLGLALESALADLPPEQREVVVLRVWGQLTFEEAAAVLDVSPNTAASRYRYALGKLRDRLGPLPKE